MIHWIGFAIFGLVVGAIARMLVPGPQPMGVIMTAVLGMVGSLLGGFVSSLLFNTGQDALVHPAGWIMSVVGAVVLVMIGIGITRRRGQTIP